MYEFLEGKVIASTPARLVLEVAGVGYELAVPLGAHFAAGSRARVSTHLVVREDAHSLYGFPDASMRDLFRLLLKVRGVGPTMALALLSSITPAELLCALRDEDLKRFTAVKGVGRKTAEQILLDLRDRAAPLLAHLDVSTASVPGPQGTLAQNRDGAVGALVSLGYSEKDARRQVERAAQEVDPGDLELLVRTALQG